MGNRDNGGRFQSAEAKSRAQAAEEALKEEREHAELQRHGELMLKVQSPYISNVFGTLSRELHQWFKHQGFWDRDWPTGPLLTEQELRNAELANTGISDRYIDPVQLRLKKMEKLGLIVTEIAEAMEAVRLDDSINEREELSDALVRIFDYLGGFGHDSLIGEAFIQKMLKNYQRPYRHGKQF